MPTFTLPIQVYWEDTDAGGIVYHANYLCYMERARSEWLRQSGFSQNKARHQENGLLFVVADISIKYHHRAQLEDSLIVTAEIERLGHASIIFDQKVMRGDEVLVSAKVRVGAINATTRQPMAIPAEAREKILPFVKPKAE